MPVAAASASGAEAASRFLRSSAGPSLRDFVFEVGAADDDADDDDVALSPSAAAAPPFSPPEGALPPAFAGDDDGRRSLNSSFSSMPAPSVVFARAEMSASMSSSVEGGGAEATASFGDDEASAAMSKDKFFARLERALQGARDDDLARGCASPRLGTQGARKQGREAMATEMKEGKGHTSPPFLTCSDGRWERKKKLDLDLEKTNRVRFFSFVFSFTSEERGDAIRNCEDKEKYPCF